MAYQRLFPAMVEKPGQPVLKLAESLHLLQSSDAKFLEKLVDEVLEKNPEKVAEYKKGKKGLIGFFMGEVMKASKGKAGPKAANEVILRKLNG